MATVIFVVLASIGLIVALIFLFVTLGSLNTDDYGYYLAFSTVVSLANVVPAAVALILGIVGRRSRSRLSLAAVIVGAVALVLLVVEIVVLAVA